jgi:MtaA/CmuA family methyltransferase
MDSIERVFAALKNQSVDKPPVFPQIGDHAGLIHDLTYNIMYEDAEKAAEAHLKALDLYGYDFVSIQVEPSWPVAEACGAKVTYPPDKNPWITNYLIEAEEDLEELEVPDFMATKSSKVMIDGTKILAEKANVPVAAFMTGPLTFSLQLMPYEVVIKHIVTNPVFIHQLVSKSVSMIKAYVKMLKEAGASILVICEHDLQLIAPQYVKKFSFNYLPNILKIYEYNILHICGRITPHLEASADYLKKLKELNTISIGPHVSISKAQKLFDNKIGVAGNIDHKRLLPSGTPQQIETAVHTAIRNSDGDSRFMVAPGCEITSDTPIENVKAFVHAVETYHK